MSGSLFSQCSRRTGLIGPWTPPAKKARMGLREGEGPPMSPFVRPPGRLISGIETSFEGWKPSDMFALHRARIEFLNSNGRDFDSSGPYRRNRQRWLKYYTEVRMFKFLVL